MEKRLARGLDALMGRGPEPKHAPAPGEIAIKQIQRNPLQPRVEFDLSRIAELAKSIEQHGLLQPVVVRAIPGGYELISGERRLRAFESLGRESIPAYVRTTEENDRLVLALVENIQRENLNAIEEARAFEKLLVEFGLTHEQVAERVGRERSTVSNALRLLDLPDSVLELVSRGTIAAGHARALLPVSKHAKFADLLREVVEGELSVRATERRVRETLQAAAPSPEAGRRGAEKPRRSAVGDDLEAQLRAHWGVMVQVRANEFGGDVTFRCGSKAELDYLLRRLQSAKWDAASGDRFSDFEID